MPTAYPFGNAQGRRFTGQKQDSTGLMYFNFRYFDPQIGAFISPDTLIPTPTDLYSYNRYMAFRGNPMRYTDPTGHFIETLWDAANVGLGVASLGYNLYNGNWSDAAWDAGGLAIDVAATAIPFIPGGAATAIKAGRAVNATADLVGVVNKVDNVVDAAKTAERVDDAVDLGKQLDNVPCPFNSFSAETPVLTEDGPRPISELVEGDLVYAWNEVTQQIKLQPILDTISHHDPSIVLLALAGETLETTDEHPFYVVEESEWSSYLSIGKWVEAGDLQPGDAILQADGETGEVLSVQVVAAPQWMYNLSVDVAHTFFVGQQQWLVHNCGGAPIHHIATNKNMKNGGAWTPMFQGVFEKAGMTLNDALNKIAIPGHKGPHPHQYHQIIYDRLTAAVSGLSGNEYAKALQNELQALGQELLDPNNLLNKLVTKK